MASQAPQPVPDVLIHRISHSLGSLTWSWKKLEKWREVTDGFRGGHGPSVCNEVPGQGSLYPLQIWLSQMGKRPPVNALSSVHNTHFLKCVLKEGSLEDILIKNLLGGLPWCLPANAGDMGFGSLVQKDPICPEQSTAVQVQLELCNGNSAAWCRSLTPLSP